MSLSFSIVAGGTASSGPDIANAGTLTSGDYNLIQSAVAGTGLSGATGHDLLADPQLLPLANNGGPTLTNAETTSSPGRAYIPYTNGCGPSGGYDTDERGFTRGAGGVCDVGAYEYAGVATAIRHRHDRALVRGHHAKRGTLPVIRPARGACRTPC